MMGVGNGVVTATAAAAVAVTYENNKWSEGKTV